MAHRTPSEARLLAVASSGGHWIQLMRLEPAWAGADVILACPQRPDPALLTKYPFHQVPDATRWSKLRMIYACWHLLALVRRVRPTHVLTTGAAPGLAALLAGRIFGARTLWLDSIANRDKLSLSGRLAQKVADVCLSQWQEVARKEGCDYSGAVI